MIVILVLKKVKLLAIHLTPQLFFNIVCVGNFPDELCVAHITAGIRDDAGLIYDVTGGNDDFAFIEHERQS